MCRWNKGSVRFPISAIFGDFFFVESASHRLYALIEKVSGNEITALRTFCFFFFLCAVSAGSVALRFWLNFITLIRCPVFTQTLMSCGAWDFILWVLCHPPFIKGINLSLDSFESLSGTATFTMVSACKCVCHTPFQFELLFFSFLNALL